MPWEVGGEAGRAAFFVALLLIALAPRAGRLARTLLQLVADVGEEAGPAPGLDTILDVAVDKSRPFLSPTLQSLRPTSTDTPGPMWGARGWS